MTRITIIVICGLALFFGACHLKTRNVNQQEIYKAHIFQTEKKQYGYDIYQDSIRRIHQPCIPGVPGNNGFATKEDAEKVAMLVVRKLDHGIMPPFITTKELDSLKVLLK